MAVARNNGNRVDVTFIPHTVSLADYNCSAKKRAFTKGALDVLEALEEHILCRFLLESN